MVLCRSTIIFDATVCDFTSNDGVRLKTSYCCARGIICGMISRIQLYTAFKRRAISSLHFPSLPWRVYRAIKRASKQTFWVVLHHGSHHLHQERVCVDQKSYIPSMLGRSAMEISCRALLTTVVSRIYRFR